MDGAEDGGGEEQPANQATNSEYRTGRLGRNRVPNKQLGVSHRSISELSLSLHPLPATQIHILLSHSA